MAKTLLNAVNDILTRTKILQGDVSALTTLTDTARQNSVDIAKQVVNEVIEELYSRSGQALPQEIALANITLVTSDRDYALSSDVVQLRWPLMNHTNGLTIEEYDGGFEQMRHDQLIPSNFNGRPTAAAIRPTDGQLYLNYIPTANENGDVYEYMYDKDFSLSAAADTFPFTDAVYRAVLPAMSNLFEKVRTRSFDIDEFDDSMGRAARLMIQGQQRDSWRARMAAKTASETDPFHA